MSRFYQLIRRENPAFEERIDPRDFYRVFAVKPQQSFARIRAQAGAFLVSAFHERYERNEILAVNSGTPIYGHHTWEVPRQCNEDILNELTLLNITRETLMPSLDEAASAVNGRSGATTLSLPVTLPMEMLCRAPMFGLSAAGVSDRT